MSSKTLITCVAVFAALCGANAAQYKPLPVDGDGKLAPKSKFVSANGIATTTALANKADKATAVANTSLSVFVDMATSHTVATPPTAFTDIELKVLDSDGNEVYFMTTSKFNSSIVYKSTPAICDTSAVVYFYCSGASDKACARPKVMFSNFMYSAIGIAPPINPAGRPGVDTDADDQVRITAIQVYPNAEFLPLFTNPDNTIIVLRQTPTLFEKDGKGEKLWRPAIIQYQR